MAEAKTISVDSETARVKFLADGILVGERSYNVGEVADVPADRVKHLLSHKVAESSTDDVTDFSAEKAEKKPKKVA